MCNGTYWYYVVFAVDFPPGLSVPRSLKDFQFSNSIWYLSRLNKFEGEVVISFAISNRNFES